MATDPQTNTGGTDVKNPVNAGLSKQGKIIAGSILISIILLLIAIIICCWPDASYGIEVNGKLPSINGKLVLLLVATAGMLGNMIHISNSFTAYIGSGKFEQKWMLWYFVTPFTAPALALILFFAIYKGDVDISKLYQVMAVAALAGLFTDITTRKLKEIFETLLNAKDDRTGKITQDKSNANTDNTKAAGGNQNETAKNLQTSDNTTKAPVAEQKTQVVGFQTPGQVPNGATTNQGNDEPILDTNSGNPDSIDVLADPNGDSQPNSQEPAQTIEANTTLVK